MKHYIFGILLCILLLGNEAVAQRYYNKKQIDCLLFIIDNYGDSIPNHAVLLSLEAFQYSKKINYQEGSIRSFISASKGSYELEKYEDAIHYAIQAEKLLENIKESKYKVEAIRLKAISYTALGFYDKGRKALNRGLVIANNILNEGEKHKNLGLLYSDIAINLKKNHESKDSIIYFFRKGYKEFDKMNDNLLDKKANLSLATLNLGSSFITLRQKDSAEYYLNKSIALTEQNYFKSREINASFDLGKLFYDNKEYNKSIFYFDDAVIKAKKINKPYVLRELYRKLSKSFDAKGDDTRSKEYLIKYVLLNDSLVQREKEKAKNSLIQAKKQLLVERSDANNYIIFLIIILFIVSIVSSFFFFTKYKKEEANRKINAILLEEKKEQLKDVVKNKKVVEIPTKSTSLEEVIQLAMYNEPSFFLKFQELYPDFCDEIVRLATSFGATDLKFCALLKLDFTTKEIAQYLNVSVRSVEGKKYRIRKKLDIPSEEDLNIWMMNI